MTREFQFSGKIEDPGPPAALIGVQLKEDRLEVPQFPSDPRHLGSVQAHRIREHGKAVATVGLPREDIDVVVAHGQETTHCTDLAGIQAAVRAGLGDPLVDAVEVSSGTSSERW